MQQTDKGVDIYFPHNEGLRNQLKYTSQIWYKKQPYEQKGQILVSGTLTKLTKDKKQVQCKYELTADGVLIKLDSKSNQPKSYFNLLARFVFLQHREDQNGQSNFQLEQYGKRKVFGDTDWAKISNWVDHLCQFCVGRGFIAQRFEFQTQIGKGNFSKVYLVQQQSTKVKLAAKSFLKEDIQRSTKLKDSVLSEALMLRKLKHPNVINLVEVHEDSTSLYFIYPLYNGGDLFEKFRAKKSAKQFFTETEVAQFMTYIFRGLAYIHKKEILHRDLKLENILLTQQNGADLVISDFGLSTHVSSKGGFKKCGTPGYIAPEILNIGVYNEKADIFSAGVICYILLTQKPVFRGNNISTILTENTSGRINYTFEAFTKLSKKAQDFLKSVLNIREDQRPSADQCLQSEFLKDFLNLEHSSTNTMKLSQKKQTQPQVPQYLASSVMPKSINLQKARRRSMRQYILLKQALSTQKQGEQAATNVQMLQQMNEVPEEQEIMEDESKDTMDDNKLIVSESVEKMKNSFYTEKAKEDEEEMQSDSNGSELEMQESDDEAMVSEVTFEDSLAQKMNSLNPLKVQHKINMNMMSKK